jgi:predicted dehydrogenase
MDTISWGIIGVGDVTEVKSGPAFQKADGSTLVAVMRRTGEKARSYAERHRVPRWYDRADRLINDPEVDAVYIATPPDSHRDYTLEVAAAGKPVYVEKPMARSAAECEEMIAACAAAGVPLYVAYYRRALPAFVLVRNLVRAQLLGRLRYVRVHLEQPPLSRDYEKPKPWRLRPAVSGGGRFVDLASHTLDFLDYVLGPIGEVHGTAVNRAGIYEPEDTVTASFSFPGGIPGSGSWCFVSHAGRDVNEIVGELGTLRFPTFADEPVVLETRERRLEFPVPKPAHVHLPLVQTVVDELRGIGTCPSTGETGARTNRVMDAILASYYGA